MRRFLSPAVALILLFYASSGYAAPSFAGASSHASKSSGRSLAWTHDLPAGVDRVLVVSVTLEDNQELDPGLAVLFDDTPMLPVPGGLAAESDTHGFLRTQLFYLLDSALPPAGSYTINVSLAHTVHEIGGGAISLAGLTQQPPAAVATAHAAAAESIATVVTTDTPYVWIVEAVGSDRDAPLAAVGGQALGFATTGRAVSVGGSASAALGSGSRSFGWSSPEQGRLAQVAAAFTYLPDFSQLGWATAGDGTMGGEGGPEVVVDTLAALKRYAGEPGPYVIKIAGTIYGNEGVRVRSNKTILGIGTDARLLGVGLVIGWSSETGQIGNVIVRNVTFEKAKSPLDGIAVSYGARNVWVDHCNFLSDRSRDIDYYDGLLDITNGADFVTASWSRFSDHYKTSLVGSSDSSADLDAGHLTVTYHHNSFINSGTRNPSVRFGLVHVFNNYYLDPGDYGIASRMNAEVVIENNWFERAPQPIRADTSLSPVPGRVRGTDTNIFVDSGPNSILTPPATWMPPYPYTLEPPEIVPEVVSRWAGVGILAITGERPSPTPPTITTRPASQQVEVGQPVAFSVMVDGTYPFSYQWLKDGQPIPGATSESLALEAVQLADAGSYTVAVTNVAGSVVSDPAVLTVRVHTENGPALFLQDRFTDGARTNQALPDSSAWFTSSGSSNLTLVAGELKQAVSSSRTLLTYFTDTQGQPAALGEGETLRVVFTFRATAFDTQADNFRVALLRSVANPDAAVGTGFVPSGSPNVNARVNGDFGSNGPGSGVFLLYSGYGAFTTTRSDVASSTPVKLYARTGTSTTLLGSSSPYTLLTSPPATPAELMSTSTLYQGTFSIARSATGNTLTYTLVRVSDGVVIMTRTAEDPAISATAFDTFAIYVSKGSAPNFDLYVTAIDVERVVP